MKKILVLVIFMFSYLFAIDKATAIQAVQANPSLLNTPQAQQLMAEKGLNKDEILQKINGNKNNISNIKNKKLINNISENSITENNITENNITENNSPLSYISEKSLIKKIQSVQQKEKKITLKRYGERFFYNKNKLNTEILSVPNYYQVNKGDILSIQIFGGYNKTLTLTVDNKGNINIPILGPLYIAGMSVSRLKSFIKRKLKPTYRNSNIVVNLKVNSFIQVTLSGFVKAPGIYNLTSLSTIKDLLITANGFGKFGSMRNVYLKRGGKTLKIIDFYKLIKNGNVVDTTLLRNGDIIFVPKAKTLVNLTGDVNVPAIYELQNGEKLKDLINYGGGLKADASKKFIKITRFVNNSYTKVLFKTLNSNEKLLNGDNLYIYKISELNKNLVYVYGNIEKPGTFELPKDKKLKTLLNNLVYLKNTYYKYGIIETFEGEIISFNLKNPIDITLNYKDKIYVFNKYEVLPEDFVKIDGDVVKHKGLYRYLKGITLQDVINNAGITPKFYPEKVKIISYDENKRPVLHFVDYTKNPNYKLKAFDEITLFSYYDFNTLKPIFIGGEVHNPDIYTYSKNMTLKDLITSAGWITDKADINYIEIIRYKIENNKRIRIIKKLSFDNLDEKLQPYDEVSIKKIPDWNDRKLVTLNGEVKYPGVYTIKKGDTLYSIIERAGGFTKDAYLYGAVFTRESIKKMQEQRMEKMIYKLKKKVSIISASAKGAGQGTLDAQNLISAIDNLAQQAKKLKPIGRMAITLNKNLDEFKKSKYNIKLQNGDELYIPTKPDSVIVLGEVLTPTAFVYTDNSALKYIQNAGGKTNMAENIYFVVHANGFTEKGSFGWIDTDVTLQNGDAITVPIKIETSTWYGIAKDITSIVYQLAITAASLKTVGAL